jgi:hypothetical protein
VSKKEIRRAARDAYPKAKGAAAARGRRTGGAYGKRQRTVSGRPVSGGRAVPRPPSIRRSLIFGVVAGVLYFLFIQWGLPKLFHVATTSVASNLVVSAVGMLLFAGANYLSERYRYRRYVAKSKDSSK